MSPAPTAPDHTSGVRRSQDDGATVIGSGKPAASEAVEPELREEPLEERGEDRAIAPAEVLRWLYLARVGLAGGLFAAAVLAWSRALPDQTLAATLALVTTLVLTPLSYWFTHVREQRPGARFMYAQSLLDVLLVTLIVHLTGGRESVVAPLYIPLIAAYSLMLPLRGGLTVTGLASLAYIGDVVLQSWAQGTGLGWGGPFDTVIAIQLAIFVSVAVVVGMIATKLREAGAELSSVEHALRRLKLETDDILSNIPTAVLTIDSFGRLAYANLAAEQLLDIDAETWLGHTVVGQIGRRSPGLKAVLERAREHGISIASAEIEVYRGGGTVPVGVSTAVLQRPEGPPSVTAIMRDISDRKRVERLRQRTERLEAVAEMSAVLAHEIKNPLASISSSVQQLRLPEDAEGDQRLLSGLILKESDRLSRLLSDFIDFARVHVERTKRLDLREVAEQAVAVARQHPAFGEGCEIELRLEDGPVRFEGDEDLMHRVVLNLVLNGLQTAVPGRPATVEVEVKSGHDVALQGVDILDPVLLSVSDNGSGIDEADLERIFDPFFSKRKGGTGLGLAIVHRAVREHRGTVLVSSLPETGTRFTVCLPRKRGDQNQQGEDQSGS